MHPKSRDFLARGWPLEANLSFFLFLLILAGFVLPSIGFEKHNLLLYADVTFSVALVAGAAIAWGEDCSH